MQPWPSFALYRSSRNRLPLLLLSLVLASVLLPLATAYAQAPPKVFVTSFGNDANDGNTFQFSFSAK